MIKETYARVTLRGKRKSVDEVSDSGQMKRAREMSNILDHTLENDKDAKAAIVAKIIDHEGPEFGSKLEMRSKVLQKSRKLNPEQTASLMAASGSTDYSWRVGRTRSLKSTTTRPAVGGPKTFWEDQRAGDLKKRSPTSKFT